MTRKHVLTMSLWAVLGMNIGSNAAPITLQLVSDTELSAVAVISGAIDDSTFGDETDFQPIANSSLGFFKTSSVDTPPVGTKWKISAAFLKFTYYFPNKTPAGVSYSFVVNGQHLVRPTDHPTDTMPNNLVLAAIASNLGASGFPVPETGGNMSKLKDELPHPADHADLLFLEPLDLNGPAAGIVSDSSQVALNIRLFHVPETGTAGLMMPAAALLLTRNQRKRLNAQGLQFPRNAINASNP